jgi:hypothetical protein
MLTKWKSAEVRHFGSSAYDPLWITQAVAAMFLSLAIGVLWFFHSHLLVRQMGTYDWILMNAEKKKSKLDAKKKEADDAVRQKKKEAEIEMKEADAKRMENPTKEVANPVNSIAAL